MGIPRRHLSGRERPRSPCGSTTPISRNSTYRPTGIGRTGGVHRRGATSTSLPPRESLRRFVLSERVGRREARRRARPESGASSSDRRERAMSERACVDRHTHRSRPCCGDPGTLYRSSAHEDRFTERARLRSRLGVTHIPGSIASLRSRHPAVGRAGRLALSSVLPCSMSSIGDGAGVAASRSGSAVEAVSQSMRLGVSDRVFGERH
jgi:hypothetical protein